MASRRFALPPVRCAQQAALRLVDCLAQCRQKSHRDRRARRVRSGASCAAVTAEQGLNLFVARQVSPGGAFFDDFPFLIGDVIVVAPLFELPHEPRDFLLILLRPGQHPIKNFLHLLLGHGAIIPNGLDESTIEMARPSGFRAIARADAPPECSTPATDRIGRSLCGQSLDSPLRVTANHPSLYSWPQALSQSWPLESVMRPSCS